LGNVVHEFLDGTQLIVLRPNERAHWDRYITSAPNGHLLQSWAWGELKRAFGWTPLRIALWDLAGEQILAGAQALLRPLPALGLSMAYIPKGPVLDWNDTACAEGFFAGLHAYLRSQRVAFLRLEPDLPKIIYPSALEYAEMPPALCCLEDEEVPLGGLYSAAQGQAVTRQLCNIGFQPVQDHIQQLRTIMVDLSADEETIARRQHKTRRYNANLAARKGVTIRQARSLSDLERWYALFETTRTRDGFESRTFDYFRQVWQLFRPAGQAELLLAEHDGKLLAGAFVTLLGKQSIYLYAASSNEGRKLMPNDLLQREMMRWAKNQGATLHDLWGIAETNDPADPLAGVTHFKRGWGGQVVEYIGAFDYIYAPSAYRVFLAGRTLAKPFIAARARLVRKHAEQAGG
jgi:lipid II:glycine glycyltransferase (peptidoglycan interpeptide bridge formation enzyme)